MIQESSAVVQAKEGKVYQVQVRQEEEDKKELSRKQTVYVVINPKWVVRNKKK